MVSFKTFSKFFDTYINDAVLSEARFRQSKKVKHIADLPMFSLFIDNDILDNENADKLSDSDVQSAFKEARNKISKMGFPAMHANVVFKDLSEEVNQNTGGDVGGQAHQKGKYMAIGIKYISNPEYFVKLIIHEWAHLWMFNNSKGFKKAVKEYYKDLLDGFKPKAQHNETELSDENRSLIFKQLEKEWIPMINKRLFSDVVKNEWQTNQYILNYNHLTINDAEYLPHLSQLRGISKQKFSDISVGDEIYLDKVNNGWLIGSVKNINNINRSRREMNIPFDQLLSYVDSTPEEIERQFNEIKKPYRPVSAIELRKQVAKYVTNAVERALSNTMYNIMKTFGIYNYKPDIYKNFKDAALKILLPNVLKYLRNIVKKPRLGSDDEVYSKFWTTPVSKAGISYIKEFTRILLDSQLNQFSNLSGKDKSSYREQMKDLVEWTDSYGMSNDDELWATGVEEFLKLPSIHRKNILRLMATR